MKKPGGGAPKNTKARKRPAGRAGLFPGLSRPVDWGESHISSYKGVRKDLRYGRYRTYRQPSVPSADGYRIPWKYGRRREGLWPVGNQIVNKK